MVACSAAAATCLSAPGSAAADPSPAPSTALGTGNGPLRYRICVPCSKRPPPVRDAFSEAFGVKNRLLRYGRDIRCQKQPSLVRNASSKARRTADSTDCVQLPVVRDAFSEACRAKSSLLPHRTHLQCAKRPPRSLFAPAAPSLAPSTALGTRNGPRSEVSRHKKETKVKDFDLFCRGTVTRTQDPLVPNQMR